METIPWPTVTAAGGGWLLTGLFVFALIRGALVPRKTLDDTLHDRDEWRAESRVKDAQIAEQALQLRVVTEVGSTVNNIMNALKRSTTVDEDNT